MLENNQVNKSRQEFIAKVENVLVTIYFLALTIIYPLFVKDGYQRIGEIKYLFFRFISIIITAVIIFVMFFSFFIWEETMRNKIYSVTTFYKRISITDLFVYGFFLSVLLSYIYTPYKIKAFWGAEGWYMGLISQVLFISIYFLFSRYFIWNNKALYVILLSSGLVFLLGILNRYSIYPIYLNGQTPVFISTLGNINWFCGYLAVISPLGIVFYWKSESLWQQAAAGVYVVISFLIGIVQGSSSAFLVFAGIFVFLFVLSFEKNKKMYRFLQLCILFALSCQIARILRYVPGFTLNYENELGTALTDSNLTLFIGIILTIIYFILSYQFEKKKIKIKMYKNIRNIALIIIAGISLTYILLLAINTRLSNGISILSGVSLFTFDENWASHRGATWSVGMRAYFSMSPLYKLIGVGPDCFAEYVYSVPGLSEYVYSQFGGYRLTNAHNEWLTMLVDQGIIGLACYVGIFVTAFIRFIKKADTNPALYLCAASILIYTVHNMVSFQQVLNAPFVFMILGIGEGILRKSLELRTYSK